MEYVHPKHRVVGQSVEERRQEAEEARKSTQELVRESNLSPKYEGERARAWELWTRYALETNLPNPHDTFKDLCSHHEHAKRELIQFLKAHLRQSLAWRHCLGPEETKEVPTIKAATTIIAFWRALVVEADDRVLRPMREAHLNEMAVWRLTWSPGGSSRGQGPVHDISQALRGSIADEFELDRKQSFEKREATIEDILLVLNVLWRRPHDIPCTPDERHAFHTAVIMAGLGFRPGSVTKLRYKQVKLYVALDPATGNIRPYADVTVYHEKQETNKVYKKQDDVCAFRVLPVSSCQSLCLLSFISSRALADGACNPHFSSQKELLERPRLEGQSALYIDWKPQFRDKYMFPITYGRFWELWNRCWTVLGCEDKLRPYALRVGAGVRYEEAALSEVMQSYILSNTSSVRQSSYQPRSISKNILALSYGLADRDEMLRNALRNSSARRDENAPLYLAPGDAEAFEERFDMRSLRQQYDEARSQYGSSHGRTRRLAGDISVLKANLSSLLIDKRRAEYFEAARVLRASGLPTDDLVQASVGPPKSRASFSFPAAAFIGRFLTQNELVGERRTEIFPTLLQTFLSSQFASVQMLVEELCSITPDTCDSSRQDVQSVCEEIPLWRCLLCPKTTLFKRRFHLSRHHHQIHLKNPEQFHCPECFREEGKTLIVSGPGSAWFNHAERTHGKHTAPYLLRQGQLGRISRLANSIPKHVRCFFCDDRCEFTAGRQFSQHFNKMHASTTYGIFHCPECRRNGSEEKITGQAAWLEHAWAVHKCDERGFPLDTQERTKAKRQWRKREQIAGGDNQRESQEPTGEVNTALVPSNKPCHGCTDKRARKPRCCVRRPGADSCEECNRRGIECLSRAGYGQTCSKCIAARLICWLRPGSSSCVACSKSQITCERGHYKRKSGDSKMPATHSTVPLSAIDSASDISEIDSTIDLSFDTMVTDLDMATGLSLKAWQVDPDLDVSTIDSDFDEFSIDPELLGFSGEYM